MYVHFIDRLVKRLASKGFKIKMPTSTLSDLKTAILIDPNGIQVRLVELPNDYLGEVDGPKKTVC